MSHIPGELKYATSHEWVRIEANGGRGRYHRARPGSAG